LPKFLISFDFHAMDHVPSAEMPFVGAAANAVVEEARSAGVLVFAAGVENRAATTVGTDGSVQDGPMPGPLGGFTIVDVSSRDEALRWAAKIAAACRCAQEVWEVA
jgi:hypothetical protein